jgi:hypothetical protein
MSAVIETLDTIIDDLNLYLKTYPPVEIELKYNDIEIYNKYTNLYMFLTECTNLIDVSITNQVADIIYETVSSVATKFYISVNSVNEIFNNIKTKYLGYSIVELYLYNIPVTIGYREIIVDLSKMVYLIYNSIIKDKVDLYLYNIFNGIIKNLDKDIKHFSIIFNYDIRSIRIYVIIEDKIYPVNLK